MKNFENTNHTSKEEKVMSWKEVFSRHIGELTGHLIASGNIYSDENGWYYYLYEKSLEKNHPIVFNHYRGPLFVVIPYKEYAMLETGDKDPVEYIDNAFWNFGYYWGGGSMVGGSYWQPFEETPGIHAKDKISQYLTILSCRTALRVSGYEATAEDCMKCKLKSCYLSDLDSKHCDENNGKFLEKDYRIDFFQSMNKRVERETGLRLQGMCLHSGDADKVELVPNRFEEDTCLLNIPVELNNNLLYHPMKRDFDELCDEYTLEIVVGPEERLYLEAENDEECKALCQKFLMEHGIIDAWNDWKRKLLEYSMPKPEVVVQQVAKVGFFRRFLNKVTGK